LAVPLTRLKQAAFGVGGYAVLLIVICLVLFVVALLLRGMVWAADKLMPWLVNASTYALLVCILVFLPLCAFRRTRPWAGIGFVYASLLFGAMLFAYSSLFVVFAWGYGALAIGLLFAGVGVVPVALLAAIFRGEWAVFWELIFVPRILGTWLTFIKKPEDVLVDY
jgi:hypothetical protein